ncbi:MAG: hypothetical protein ACXVPN_03025 [Bacteroidia bacterium]
MKKTNKTKNTLLLLIIALTCLSATLLHDVPGSESQREKPSIDKETTAVKKLKTFDVKNYLTDYERQKKARRMINLALTRDTIYYFHK